MVQIFIPDGQRPSVTLVYGKAFQITPSDPNQQVEVQRATDSVGTGATTFLSGVICNASGSIFVDQRANDGSSWFYRARHNSPGFDPGGWTDWVGGVVVLIPKAVLAAANNGTNLIIPPPYPATAFTQSGLTAFNQANIWNYDIVDTAWHTDSAVPGAWLQLDAASAKNMIECRIYALSAAYAGVYDIEYSDNASTWTAASTGFKPLALGLNVRRWASAGSHRYWRIKLTNTPGGGPWCSELHWIEAPSGGVLKPWIMPPVVYDGGNEKVHLTIDDTLTRFRPGVTESGSRAVNLLYAKASVGAVDTYDGIVDGTTYRRITGVSGGLVQTASVANAAVTTALIADANVTKAKMEDRFRCKAFSSVAISLTNDTAKDLPWDSEVYDVGSLHDTVTNPERITVPTGGDIRTWLIQAMVEFDASTVGYREVIIWHKNSGGTEQNRATQRLMTVTTASVPTFLVASLVISDATVGDFFVVSARQNSGGSLQISSGKTNAWFAATHLW